jgi:aldose 1-epimerase
LVAPQPGADPRKGLDLDRVELDNVFTGWRRRAEIVWPEAGAAMAIEGDPPLDFLVVYVLPGKDFFCAEPVSNVTDAFNLAASGRTDTGMIELTPGATQRARMRLVPRKAG